MTAAERACAIVAELTTRRALVAGWLAKTDAALLAAPGDRMLTAQRASEARALASITERVTRLTTPRS